jgi:hypothetical protein
MWDKVAVQGTDAALRGTDEALRGIAAAVRGVDAAVRGSDATLRESEERSAVANNLHLIFKNADKMRGDHCASNVHV